MEVDNKPLETKMASAYYYKYRTNEEYKRKRREKARIRYIERKKQEYLEKHGTLNEFIIPKQYDKN